MTTPANIKKGRKYDTVLKGACDVFMRDGFEGASVDNIARVANVSKATLYSYFPDKRELFIEVVRNECARMANETLQEVNLQAPPAEVMLLTANSLLRFLLSDFSLKMFRICVAESARFPELGQAFYKSGPEMGRARMVEYLNLAIARGELIDHDPAVIADQFSELCKANLWTKAIFGVQSEFSQKEIRAVAEEATKTILARYSA